MTAEDLKAGLCCSFCLRLPAQVAKLVAGPGVFICNECVDLCNHVIAQAPQSPPGVRPDSDAGAKVEAWHKRFSDDDLLNHLPKVAAASAQVEQQLTTWVRDARSRGITWTRIGEALSMTRQSAWERFSGED